MAAPAILLQKRLMAGVYSVGGGEVVIPGVDPVVTIDTSFASVGLSTSETVTATVILRRNLASVTQPATFRYRVEGTGGHPLTADYMESGSFPDREFTFPLGIAVLPVTLVFAQRARPADELEGLFTLYSPTPPTRLGPPAQVSFRFTLTRADETGPIVPTGGYDDPTFWAILKAANAPGLTTSNITNATGLRGLANAEPGTYYVVTGDINGGNITVTVDADGTKENPVVICGSVAGSLTGLKELTNVKFVVTGSHVYFRDLALGPGCEITLKGTRNSVERCWGYGMEPGLEGATIWFDSRSAGRYLRVRYCEFAPRGTNKCAGGAVGLRSVSGNNVRSPWPNHPRYLFVYRNRFSGWSETPSSRPMMWGRNEYDDAYNDVQAFIYDNLFEEGPPGWEPIEVKVWPVVIDGNTMDSRGNGQKMDIRCRHSLHLTGGLDIAAGATAVHGTIIQGNLWVRRPGETVRQHGGPTVRTKAKVRNNWSVVLADGEQPTRSSPLASDEITLWAGNLDPDRYPTSVDRDQPAGSRHPCASYCDVGGNRMAVIVGSTARGYNPTIHAIFNRVAPGGTSARQRNRSVSKALDKDFHGRGEVKQSFGGTYGDAFGSSTTIDTNDIEGADYDKVPFRWTRATVGVAAPETPGSGGGGGGGSWSTADVAIGNDLTTNYAAKLGDNTGTLTQLSGGVKLTAGAYNAEASGIRVYGKKRLGPGKLRLKLRRNWTTLPTVTTDNGRYCFIGLVKATGVSEVPANLPTDSSTDDNDVASFLTGWRLTMANLNTTGSAQSNRLRMRCYDGAGGRTAVNPGETAVAADFGLATTVTVDVEWRDGFVSVTCLGVTQTFSSPLIAGEGYLMLFASPGMDATFSSIEKIA